MAIEFIEGFDHYLTHDWILTKWDSTSAVGAFWAMVTGRFGGSALWGRFGGTTQHLNLTSTQLSAVATRVFGASFNFQTLASASSGAVFLAFQDGASTQVDLRINSSGTLTVTRNGTLLATGSGTIVQNNWYYIELKVTIGSTGSFTLNVEGSTWATSGSANTQATGNATTNALAVVGLAGDWFIDDVYVLNTSGSANNDLLGPQRIYTVLPTADDTASPGTNLLWTPNSGTAHFSRVNETDPNSDTSYVSTTTAGNIDTYTYPAVSPTTAVAAVQVVMTARKDDGVGVGTRVISAEYRSGSGTNYTGGTAFTVPDTYKMCQQIFENDPNTSSPWSTTDINAGEFGIKCIS